MSKDFPTHGLLPKDATQASSFLKKYPKYDGDGIIIAILDTGVDPGAPGLQTTSRNQTKIVDIVDCCGSGDVKMDEECKAELVDGVPTLKSKATGRTLRLGKQWNNPSGIYRMGTKRAYEVYPANLVERMKKERKEKFEREQQQLLSKAQRALSDWEKANNASSGLKEDQMEEKADLEARIETLQDLMKNYDDCGPVFDCIVWNDGSRWRCAIDLRQDGDLEKFQPMTDYKYEHQFTQFDQENMLNFSVNLYDEGKTLSLVTVAGAHGTHVAAISAANYPNEPELNGIAPGAKIVSLKIGETRLGSMETGTGLSRALTSIIENKCQLCNMSYGEDAGVANEGRWIELLRDELIAKRHVIFVSSAGNAGPALSTVGAPGGTTDGVIGVGAYVTAEMVQAEYALLDSVPERPYTWSSRGPGFDGSNRVSIYAPGAAITSVPQYLLKNTQLMNGTSMSSPNACGNLALIMSACLDLRIPLSPYRLRTAVENTAKCIGDELKVGFLQVEKVFEYLQQFKDDYTLDIQFQVSINSNNTNSTSGIYLRERLETQRLFHAAINVQPTFRKDHWAEENPKRLDYEHRLLLITTAPFVKCPEYLLMNSGGRDFQIRVDPTALSPGLHYAEVGAYICHRIESGPVFKIPITITKGEDLVNNSSYSFKSKFSSGQIERRFVNVPKGVTWAKLKVKARGSRLPGRLVVHLMQLLPSQRHSRTEHQWYLTLNGDDPIPEKTFQVYGGSCLEVCFAQFWSSLGTYEIEVEIDFHGLTLEPSMLAFDQSQGCTIINLYSHCQQEQITPSISFDYLRRFIRPSEAQINPLSAPRDQLINNCLNLELVLKYNISVRDQGSTITVRKPVVDDLLYDSLFDSALVMLHDSSKRMLYFGDIYPKPWKLDKGEYTLRIQLRHDQQDLLEKMKQMAVQVDLKLSSSVQLNVYDSRLSVFANGSKKVTKPVKIDAGDSKRLFLDLATVEKLPKDAKTGDLLVGKFGVGTEIETNAPIWPASFQIIQQNGANKSEGVSKEDENDLSKINEIVRDAKLQFFDKLQKTEEKRTLMTQLLKEFPDHVPVLLKNLEFVTVNELETPEAKASQHSLVVRLADELISKFQISDVLAFLAARPPQFQTEEYKRQKKDMEESKRQISWALYRKAQVLLCALFHGKSDSADVFNQSYSKLLSLSADVSELQPAILFLSIARDWYYKRYGSALKQVVKYLSDNASPSLKKSTKVSNFLFMTDSHKSIDNDLQTLYAWKLALVRKLEWNCWNNLEMNWSSVRFPTDYAPF